MKLKNKAVYTPTSGFKNLVDRQTSEPKFCILGGGSDFSRSLIYSGDSKRIIKVI